MASGPQKKSQTDKQSKTLTLSFNDDNIIVVEDSTFQTRAVLPENMNGSFIDLTEDFSPVSSHSNHRSAAVAHAKEKNKTLEFDMMISKDINNLSSLTTKPFPHNKNPRAIDLNNNPKASTSKAMAATVPDATRYNLRKATASRKALELSLFTGSVVLKERRNNSNTTKLPKSSVYEKLLEIGQKKLIENYEEFVCSLCNGFCIKGVGVTLKFCLHSFCKPCLVNTINTKSEFGVVKCPLEVENCESNIDDAEIQELLGTEGYKAFLENLNLSFAEIEIQKRKAKEDEDLQQALIPLLLNMDDLETIPNLKAFECPVCFSEVNTGEGVLLKNCLHPFCRECLAGCITASEDFEVKCPFINPDNVGCDDFLQEREIRSLVSQEDFDKHLQKSLNVAEHSNELTFHCRTPNCPAFVEVDPQIKNYICEVCRKQNCIECKAVHEGKSCMEYQEDMNPELKDQRMRNEIMQSQNVIDQEVAAGTSMYCPRCKTPVMKILGCDYITCTACKLGICWCTKKPRLPFKRTDGTVVEGCKCREPGFGICHPNCKNCH